MVIAESTASTIITVSFIDNFSSSDNEHHNFSAQDLEKLNDQRARTLIPAMSILGVLMMTGIVGNSLAFYVFAWRLPGGTQNFLIVCLALFDLLSCIVCIPGEIADMGFNYLYSSEIACKILRFTNTFTIIASICTLFVIAIDRYRKICKPFQAQLDMNRVRLSLIPILGLALLFAWPAILIYGLRTNETSVIGLMGKDCSTSDDLANTVYPLIYNSVLFLAFIILAIVLVILYIRVLRETKRHHQYLKRNSNFSLPSGSYNSEESHSSVDTSPSPRSVVFSLTNARTSPGNGDDNDVRMFDYGPTAASTFVSTDATKGSPAGRAEQDSSWLETSAQGTTSAGYDNLALDASDRSLFTTSAASAAAAQNTLPTCKSFHSSLTNGQQQPQQHKKTRHVSISSSVLGEQGKIKVKRMVKSKTTIISFLITLVFIMSFLPHLSLQVVKIVDKGFDLRLEGAHLVAYNVFLRSYFINSVSNPIIYGALNVMFKEEVKALTKSLCQKCPVHV